MRELHLGEGGAATGRDNRCCSSYFLTGIPKEKRPHMFFYVRWDIFHRLKERERESRLVTGFRSSILSSNSGTVSVLRVNPEIGTQVTLMSNNHA